MKYLLLFLFTWLLGGCITVAVPPSAPPVVIQTPLPKTECGLYNPPLRKTIPMEPTIAEAEKNYVRYLEELAENLVAHVVVLRKYIDDEHLSEDDALMRYRRDCIP